MEISSAELRVLQRLAVESRLLAYRGEDLGRIARILDEVDGLLGILAHSVDHHAEFREAVEGISVFYPELRNLVLLKQEISC